MLERRSALLLHGYSGNGSSILNLASEVFGTEWTVEAPDGPYALASEASRAWWRRVGEPAEMLDDEQLLEADFSIQTLASQVNDAQHVVVGGFSQGAATALALVTRVAEHRAIDLLFMSGRSPWPREMLEESLIDIVPARAMICHGRQDLRVPFAEAEMVLDVLLAHGWSVSTTLTDHGHRVTASQRQAIRGWVAEVG
ncbi:MAG TPA: hypothetical protein QF646_07600 [Candidatus Poseidoniales archaeon]|nr:hypothetical protein [Candidatus Poseidoniales archaeon]